MAFTSAGRRVNRTEQQTAATFKAMNDKALEIAASYGCDKWQIVVPTFGRLWLRVRGSVAAGHFADEGEEGEVHGDDDAADGYSQEADHDRLYEGEEVGDG